MCLCIGTKVCTGCCCSSRYYSDECRTADWSSHKLLCPTFKDFQSRPNDKMKRALLFRAESKKPRWIWVPFVWRKGNDYEPGFEHRKPGVLLGKDGPARDRRLLGRNDVQSQDLANSIEVVMRDGFLVDGSQSNRSIKEATRGWSPYEWKGPVVVFLMQGTWVDRYYGDLSMNDFRDVVDFFTTYGEESDEASARRPGKVKGARVSCSADMSVGGVENYVSGDLPRRHPVFSAGRPSDVSRHIGRPILVIKYPADKRWKHNEALCDYSNQEASFLHISVNPNETGINGSGKLVWGWAPMSWQNEVGSALVVLQDGANLSPYDMEMICDFCQHTMGPLFEDSMGAGGQPPIAKRQYWRR